MKKFASKLLLFGEYTIINGSRALAIPYPPYSGHWARATRPDDRLQVFAAYLARQPELQAVLSLSDFSKDVEAGWYFHSNIPVGYGLGSSGALCAAVYDRYARTPIEREDRARFPELKRQLALMEGHFHGSSSGTDPLICYLGYPVKLGPSFFIEQVTLPEMTQLAHHFFLLDTGISRSTGPLVRIYLEHCRDEDYAQSVEQVLMPLVDRIIEDFLTANWNHVEQGMVAISQFQWQYFQEMIPADLKEIWRYGLDTGDYALKLCGAGGGGCLIGMAGEIAALEKLSVQFPCKAIW